jgi:hypothetical protein
MTENPIGTIVVESGVVAVLDPTQIGALAAERLCVFLTCPLGDGLYAVYEQVDVDGKRVGIRVDLTDAAEREPEMRPCVDERPGRVEADERW